MHKNIISGLLDRKTKFEYNHCLAYVISQCMCGIV